MSSIKLEESGIFLREEARFRHSAINRLKRKLIDKVRGGLMARSCFGDDSSTFDGLFADMPSMTMSVAFASLLIATKRDLRLITSPFLKSAESSSKN